MGDVCIGGDQLKVSLFSRCTHTDTHTQGSGHTLKKAAARTKRRKVEAEAEAKEEKKAEPALEAKDDPFAAFPPELRALMEKMVADERAKRVAAEKATAEAESKQRELEEKFRVKTPHEVALEIKVATLQAQIHAESEAKKAPKKQPPKARSVVLRPELRGWLLVLCSGREASDYVFRSGVSSKAPLTDKAFMKILKDSAREAFRKEGADEGLEGPELRNYADDRARHVGTNSMRKVFVNQMKIFFGGDGIKADQCMGHSLTTLQHYQRLSREQITEAVLGADFGSPELLKKKKPVAEEEEGDLPEKERPFHPFDEANVEAGLEKKEKAKSSDSDSE